MWRPLCSKIHKVQNCIANESTDLIIEDTIAVVGLVSGIQAKLRTGTRDNGIAEEPGHIDDSREKKHRQQSTASSTKTDVAAGVQGTTYHHIATDGHHYR